MGFHVAEHGGFDTAVGKIKTGTIVVGLDSPAVGSAATVAVLDLRRGELHGMRVAMRSEAVDHGAAGASEAGQIRDFGEGFSGIVVATADAVPVADGVAMLGGATETG